ncbi:40S ribosomal protein S29 [Fagus crenata]
MVGHGIFFFFFNYWHILIHDLGLILHWTTVDRIFTHHDDGMTVTPTSRRLKEDGYNLGTDKKSNAGNVNLDDYHPIDPVPSSKTSVRPGPIEHGTPVIPYIPRPSPPPGPPKIEGST